MSSLTSLNFWIGIFTLIYLLFIAYKGYHQVGYNAEILEELETGELSLSFLNKASTVEPSFLMKKPAQPIIEPLRGIQPEEELISDEIRTKLKADLLKYMEEERPFLQQKLTISQLAKSIQTNNKYLSYVLNNDFDQNFVSFINSYRVQEVKKYLQSDEYSHIKIEVIGNMAGFRSKSSFNNAFKSITLETPSAYRKRINKTS